MIKILSKKAQVGDAFVWMIGFLIIFFILVLFFGGVMISNPEKYDFSFQKKNSLYYWTNIGIVYSENYLSLFNFLKNENSRKIISDWFDGGDGDVQKICNLLKENKENIYDEFITSEKFYFCVDVVEDNSKRVCMIRDECFEKKDVFEKESLYFSRVYILSEEGKLLELFFYSQESYLFSNWGDIQRANPRFHQIVFLNFRRQELK
jgi:hypothetical protein